ncbi:hypothetical protein Tco_0001169 [Tanacetum coccineum]
MDRGNVPNLVVEMDSGQRFYLVVVLDQGKVPTSVWIAVRHNMSPLIVENYRASVAFATGCRRINKIRRGNRKIRVPIAMWPCKVEKKMTLKEVDGKTIKEFETKIITKDGTITRVPGTFQGYETSEEESVERPRKRDLYEFVNTATNF